jgi:hypothetical protein
MRLVSKMIPINGISVKLREAGNKLKKCKRAFSLGIGTPKSDILQSKKSIRKM